MKIIISIVIILVYVYYIIRKNRVQSSDSQEMTNIQKALDIFSLIVLALLVGLVWGFALGAAYQLYSFPKEHGLVFHIASLLIFIVALEILDFFRSKALKNILKKTGYNRVKDKRGYPRLYEVIRACHIGIVRHIKIRGNATPFEPEYFEYFRKRRYFKTYGQRAGLAESFV